MDCSVKRHVALQARDFFFVDVLTDLLAELFDVAVRAIFLAVPELVRGRLGGQFFGLAFFN
jgi:hypothetical protein